MIPEARPVQREISRRDNEIDKVVVSDTLTAEETEPWRETTRILSRAKAHERLPSSSRATAARSSCSAAGRSGTTCWPPGSWTRSISWSGLSPSETASAFVSKPDASLRLLEAPRTWEGSDNVLLRYGLT